jgi:hypothetical protein
MTDERRRPDLLIAVKAEREVPPPGLLQLAVRSDLLL